MDNHIIAESKKTGNIVEFTAQQWENMTSTGHSGYWKVLSYDIVPASVQVKNISEVKEIETIADFSEPLTYLDLEFKLDYRKLLDESGVKYNKNIKNPEKLKAIWEEYNYNQT